MTSSRTVELPLDFPVEGQFSFPSDTPSILALDPGGTTGWAWFEPNLGIVECGQLVGDHHKGLYELLDLTHHPHIARQVVCESFQFRQFSGFDKTKVELYSVEYIGVVKLYSQMTGVPVQFQTSSIALKFISDEKLQRLGWYKPTAGMRHARDALRHLLYYLCVTKRIREPFTDKWLRKT